MSDIRAKTAYHSPIAACDRAVVIVQDVFGFLEDLDRALEGLPTADQLRNILELIDDPSFEAELARMR